MLKGLIFDMDGTITLTEPLHFRAFSKVLLKEGIAYDFADHMKRFSGAGSETTFKTLFSEHGKSLSSEKLELLKAEKKNLYTKFVQESEIEIVKGVAAFLKKAHEKGLKIIMATGNSNLDAVRFILKKVGLLSYFPQIVSITEVAHGKPFPDVFLEAARRIHIEPSEAVVFEDSENGVEAAARAHIRSIALLTTTPESRLKAAGASYCIADFTHLTDEMLYGSTH